MYIFTCRDVWRLGGWCDKVSGCYWPEMTVKAVFANFTATSPDICLLLLRSPSLPRLRHPQRQFEKTNISKTKTLPTAQGTQGIECFDSINTFISMRKLQQSLKSWSNFSLCFVCCFFALRSPQRQLAETKKDIVKQLLSASLFNPQPCQVSKRQ